MCSLDFVGFELWPLCDSQPATDYNTTHGHCTEQRSTLDAHLCQCFLRFCLSSASDQQSQINAVLRNAVEPNLPSKWTANILVLVDATAKQEARLLALATDNEYARDLPNAFDPSRFPSSFAEPARQRQRASQQKQPSAILRIHLTTSLCLLIHYAVSNAFRRTI
ncbi:hypothetical protein BCR37DRAFT_389132 [Protomyces lactucae-debilis]|uniref:Uncharacterized protein n=1 Tax=Protomyces lactucae-debilis TaxID=2754530 RepID=A0A1Y2F1T2_PROLT|nr:uncharacterized protein BCR37DRAFT_389132 [Protomyces lactucae-debilis]ORY77306.1 hypothetical protein BCR37DRAFT_389132 [Protomyces lactucae-debilis]